MQHALGILGVSLTSKIILRYQNHPWHFRLKKVVKTGLGECLRLCTEHQLNVTLLVRILFN